jgi:hypothetical protein
VRREHHARMRPYWVVGGWRFRRPHIERGQREITGIDSMQQDSLIDDVAASNIDESRTAWQPSRRSSSSPSPDPSAPAPRGRLRQLWGSAPAPPRASALHQSSFRNLPLRFNYRSQMSQLTVTHPTTDGVVAFNMERDCGVFAKALQGHLDSWRRDNDQCGDHWSGSKAGRPSKGVVTPANRCNCWARRIDPFGRNFPLLELFSSRTNCKSCLSFSRPRQATVGGWLLRGIGLTRLITNYTKSHGA